MWSINLSPALCRDTQYISQWVRSEGIIISSAVCSPKKTKNNQHWQKQFVFNKTFFLSEWAAADQTHTDSRSCCFSRLHLFIHWLDWCSGESLHCQTHHRAAAVSLTHYYSHIQLCFLWQLYSAAMFVQRNSSSDAWETAHRLLAQIVHPHMLFFIFFQPCSQEMHSKCKWVQHSNNYSTQWFISRRWSVVALSVIFMLFCLVLVSFWNVKSKSVQPTPLLITYNLSKIVIVLHMNNFRGFRGSYTFLYFS